MDLHLKGKVVIVTGGGSGIGAGISEVLVEEGAIVVVLSRRQPEMSWIKRHQIDFIKAELSNDQECVAAIEQVRKRHKEIYGLVNNAGANDGVNLQKGPDAFRLSLDQNLIHYYTLVHLLRKDLCRSQGAIVNISSKTAVTGQGGTSAYVAAKAAQLGLTREWAVEFLPHGVRVNAIVVAEVMTPLYQRWVQSFDQPEAIVKKIKQRIPLGQRMTTPREIADCCVFLLSDRASHTTGQWIYPDGGYTHLDRAIEAVDSQKQPAFD